MKKISTFVAMLVMLFATTSFYGQATVSSGAIEGAVTDPTGAAIPQVAVTITNDDNGSVITVKTDGRGVYASGPLIPGKYSVTSSPSGFASIRAHEVVQIGNVTNGNLKLALGSAGTTIDVSGTEVRVDTAQSQVQGVVTSQQIENLPISGRNILDITQLQPGVQLQDGQGFDPTKAGYSSVSFNGVSGRNPRILLDGQDISDQTVGTAVLNVSQGAVEEVQVNRSSLDISNELTSSGSIVMSTRSGTNGFHGEAFYLFRDARSGFAEGPGGVFDPFQRNQFGGSVGGPIIKDRLFFFANIERMKQDQAAPVQIGGKFSYLSGNVDNLFKDTYSTARVDFNGPWGLHAFGRIAYEVNSADATYGYGYSRYANRDNTPGFVGGVDWNTGRITHNLRVSYLKFHNEITDAATGTHYNPIPNIFLVGTGGLYSGPNLLAPQETYQSNKQFSYNGTWTLKAHTIRFGANVDRLLGGGLASFFGLGPEVAIAATTPGGSTTDTNPLDYAPRVVAMGNGQGFFTERPGFGYSAGGQQDWRMLLYLGDSWKVKPNLTVNYGLRYQRDTGLTDSDLAPMPCSDSVGTFGADAPCTSGNLLDSLSPGLGNRVRQPNANFSPQLGFAWDPKGNGKTVIRGGGGVYFENSLFNNVQFDRPGKLKTGLFFGEALVCGTHGTSVSLPGSAAPITSIDGQTIAALCAEPVSQSGAAFGDLEKAYQAGVKAAGPQQNGEYIPYNLTNDDNGVPVFDPNYRMPRAVQLNIGVQREVWKGATFTADYVRNVTTHFTQNIDINRVGAARTLNVTAAQNAINTTLAGCGAATVDIAVTPGGCPSGSGGTAAAHFATIDDFAVNGLDSGNGAYLDKNPYSAFGYTANTGAAFPGVNAKWGKLDVTEQNGRSVYNGLQTTFLQEGGHQLPFITHDSIEISYTYSRFESTAGTHDQFFSNTAWDNDNPTANIGPGGLDRTHQLSFGGYVMFKYGPQLGFVGHLFSALPTTLQLEEDPNGLNGEIFRTDVTGDGSTGDILPGTKVGSFMRNGIKGTTINRVIDAYNQTSGGHATPAGQALVENGLVTAQQLSQMGAVTPFIERAATNQVNNGWLRTLDANLTYPIKWGRLGDKFSLTPGIAFFNLFNFANFGAVQTGTLESTSSVFQSANGSSALAPNTTTPVERNVALRLADGSGTFAQGSQRQTEYSLKLTF